MNIAYPFQIDKRGRTAEADDERHIKDLIEQVLFTSPGERVNRPTFGSGLKQLVHAPNNEALAAATQIAVQGALQQWLGDYIQVESLDVTCQDATLRILVSYVVRRTQERQLAEFTRQVG
jgi:phage baseplate assembly protein W